MAAARSAQGRVATNTIARAAGEAVAKVGSLVFYVVLARQLGSEDYGTFVFALALTGTLLIGAGFGTDELIAREVARDRAGAGRYLSDVVALKTITSADPARGRDGRRVRRRLQRRTRAWPRCWSGLGVMCEVMGKSWHAIFQAYERLGLVSAALIIQRALTAIAGIVDPARGRRAGRRGRGLPRRRARAVCSPPSSSTGAGRRSHAPRARAASAATGCCVAACRSASPACCSSCW